MGPFFAAAISAFVRTATTAVSSSILAACKRIRAN